MWIFELQLGQVVIGLHQEGPFIYIIKQEVNIISSYSQ